MRKKKKENQSAMTTCELHITLFYRVCVCVYTHVERKRDESLSRYGKVRLPSIVLCIPRNRDAIFVLERSSRSTPEFRSSQSDNVTEPSCSVKPNPPCRRGLCVFFQKEEFSFFFIIYQVCICLPGRNERSNGQRSNGSGFRSAAATLYGDDYINYECDGLVSDDDAIGSASFFLLFRLVIYFCFSVIFLFPWCLSSGSFWKVHFLLFSRRWENPAQSLVIYLNVRHVREKPPTKREISHLSFAVFLFFFSFVRITRFDD